MSDSDFDLVLGHADKLVPTSPAKHVCDHRCQGESGHHAWPSPHPEDFCELCAQANPVWFVPNSIWNEVSPSKSIICPTCFLITAKNNGKFPGVVWKLKPETDSDVTDLDAEGDRWKREALAARKMIGSSYGHNDKDVLLEYHSSRAANTPAQEQKPIENPQPIGTCPKCGTSVYINSGFCGVCPP